jgi:hypothetical protein
MELSEDSTTCTLHYRLRRMHSTCFTPNSLLLLCFIWSTASV